MYKLIRPIARVFDNRNHPSPVFVEIKYSDGKLSITGVEGPTRSGNCIGSCGQIDMNYRMPERKNYNEDKWYVMVIRILWIAVI